jgi:hypothetical protein
VLTFNNVTAFRGCIDQVIYERECAKAILNTVADPVVVLNADLRIDSGNRAFYTLFLELASLRITHAARTTDHGIDVFSVAGNPTDGR